MRDGLLTPALLATILLASSGCRGCEAAPLPSAGAGARPEEPPVGTIDAEPYRARAQVPAIAWAYVTTAGAVTGAVGLADVDAAAAALASTPFEAASIAKTVIATCVLQLVEEGRLDLDADVSGYVGFPVRHPRGSVTLRGLLSHTASLADGPGTDAPGDVPLGEFLGRYFADGGAGHVFLRAAPGTVMAYSNVGPSLAALAVERVSGTRFADRAATRVFLPLRMHATAFGRAGLAPGARAAVPHASRGDAFVRLAPPSHALYPVVDLFSSADDLARFARAVARGGELDGARVLRPETVDLMLRAASDAAPSEGLGWQGRSFAGIDVVGHEGEDLGASTALYVDRRGATGAVVLANGDAFQAAEPGRTAALGELVERLLLTARAARDREPQRP